MPEVHVKIPISKLASVILLNINLWSNAKQVPKITSLNFPEKKRIKKEMFRPSYIILRIQTLEYNQAPRL